MPIIIFLFNNINNNNNNVFITSHPLTSDNKQEAKTA